jgi:hypothetical protein
MTPFENPSSADGLIRSMMLVGAKRHPQWYAVRAKHLVTSPACAICGVARFVEVHHKVPVHVDDSLELDPGNLVTLCDERASRHHFEVGHGGDWRMWNQAIDADIEYLSGMYRRIRGMRLEAGDVADAPSDSSFVRDLAIATWIDAGGHLV